MSDIKELLEKLAKQYETKDFINDDPIQNMAD